MVGAEPPDIRPSPPTSSTTTALALRVASGSASASLASPSLLTCSTSWTYSPRGGFSAPPSPHLTPTR